MTATDRRILSSIMKHMAKADEDPLTPLIDRYYVVRDRPDVIPLRIPGFLIPGPQRLRPPGRLSPSKICGCERQAAFGFLGIQGRKRKDPQSEAVFDNGDWVHHRWEYNFLDMARVMPHRVRKVQIEKPVLMSGIFTAGTLDIELQVWSKRLNKWVWIVIDVKSINDAGFSYVWRNRRPKEEHVRQLISYMRARKRRRGALLYENKNNQEYHVFMVTFSKEEWGEVEQWCERVIDQLDRKKIPKRHPDCDHGNFLFDRCQYRGLCWGNYDTDDLQEMAYQGFDGVQKQWERALEVMNGSEEHRPTPVSIRTGEPG